MKIEIIEGIVTNDGVQIGTITDGVCRLSVKATSVLKGQINAAHGSKLTFEAASTHTEKPKEPQAPKASAKHATATTEDPEPPQNPRLGTQTPEWADWKARQPK